MSRDHYEALGAQPGDSTDDIRAAFLARMRQLHPDKLGERHESAGARADFEAARAAWEVLGDAGRRAAYDAQRSLEASRSQYAQVHVKLTLDHMELSANELELSYPCRCGDEFRIPLDAVPETPGDKLLIPCASCSLFAELCV